MHISRTLWTNVLLVILAACGETHTPAATPSGPPEPAVHHWHTVSHDLNMTIAIDPEPRVKGKLKRGAWEQSTMTDSRELRHLQIRCDERAVRYDYERFEIKGESRVIPTSDLWIYAREDAGASLDILAVCGE